MTPSLERLQALWRIRSAFEIWNYLGKLEESTRCNWIKKCKALPLGMRNQNPKHKLDQSYCWRQWQTSLFHQGIKRQVGCYSADSAPLCPETAPCWGVHLQKKGRWNEKILEMMSSIEEKKDITSFPAWSVPGFTTLLQISPSAESHWCHGIVFKYKTTSPCSLVHPLPHFLCSLQYEPQEHLRMPGCSENLSYSAGTDLGTMVRDARYYVPLSKPVFPWTDPSGSLFLIDHQPLSCS